MAAAVLTALSLPAVLPAQATSGVAGDVDRLIAYLRPSPGFDVEERARLIDLASRFAVSRDSARRSIGAEIAAAWLRAHGRDSTGMSNVLTAVLNRLVRGSYRIGPEFEYPSSPIGTLPEVIRRGNGPVNLILIPEYRKNWTIYQPFMDANAERFTFYTFSLPGYGGTLPYPLPEVADYAARPWLDGVAQAVERLIMERRIRRPVLVGSMDAGSYVAVRVAERRPDLVAGLALLNTSLYQGTDADSDTRAASVARDPVALLTVLFTRIQPGAESAAVLQRRPIPANQPIWFYTRDSAWARQLIGMHLVFRPFLERYYFEWLTADLRPALATMRVPILLLPSLPDEAAPQRSDSTARLQWQAFRRQHPDVPVQVVPVAARGLAVLDAPLEVGRALAGFIDGLKARGAM